MPITPFHFGPGILIKSVMPKYFSFRAFVLINIIIDLEAIYFVLTNQYPLHRFFHTYLGASVIFIICVIIGRPICYYLTYMWNKIFKSFQINNSPINFFALVSGTFLGAYGQVLLDSIMHSDMEPFLPWNSSNGLLYFLNYAQLHLACVVTGIIGIILYKIRHKSVQN